MEKKLNIRGTQAVSRCNKKRTMSEGKFLISRLKVSSVLKHQRSNFPLEERGRDDGGCQ